MKIISKISKIIFLLSVVAFGVTFFYLEKLPDFQMLDPRLANMPTMIDIEQDNFNLKSGDYSAIIEPKKEYEIAGLVVADYDSENWFDLSHKHDPFNTKDLCLIWGENAKSNVYMENKFWHGEWTCFSQPKSRSAKRLQHEHVSNNHLLPANKEIYKRIKNTKIGDQIYFKGLLVNYQIKASNFTTGPRSSSLNPYDNHCEVIYTTEFEVIKPGNNLVRQVNTYSLYLIIASIAVLILLFIIEIIPGLFRKRQK